MSSKLLLASALTLAAAAAHAQGAAAPAAEDGPGPNLVIEVADAAGTSKGQIVLDLLEGAVALRRGEVCLRREALGGRGQVDLGGPA